VIPFDLFDTRSVTGDDRDLPEIAAAFAELVHAGGFDLAIDLRRQPETRFLLRETGARWLAGFESTGQFPWLDVAVRWDGDTIRAPKQRHVSEDLLSLVDAVNAAFEPAAALPRVSRAKARTALAKLPGIARSLAGWSGRRWAAIHPAAGAENRRWPVQSFAALIDLLVAEEDMCCFLVGGPEDAALAQSVIDAVRELSAVRSLAGQIALSDLPLLVQSCDLFVGNNSGPQHLAAALGIPTVNVHSGVIDPHEWGPIGPAAVSVRRATVCSPCYLARIEDCHRDLACLRTLGPHDVLKACRSLLEKSASTATKSRRVDAHASVLHQPPRPDAC
jgi:ADP-heptose:LPS heptosyltransferase